MARTTAATAAPEPAAHSRNRTQPIRSPITDAGIGGNSAHNARITGSNSSTAEPPDDREYRADPRRSRPAEPHCVTHPTGGQSP